MSKSTNLLGLSIGAILGAYLGPLYLPPLAAKLNNYGLPFQLPLFSSFLNSQSDISAQDVVCPPHNYTAQLISLDPLLIYITNFVTPQESQSIINHATPLLTPSPLTGPAASQPGASQSRTSRSAPLLPSDDVSPNGDSALAINCVLSRATSFLGTLLSPGRDSIGPAQMVRYTPGQKFDLHTDWFTHPKLDDRDAESGRRRLYNRVATFFVVLQANHSDSSGETWFPFVKPATPQDWETTRTGTATTGTETQTEGGEGKAEGEVKAKGGERSGKEKVWREHEQGGLAFRAVPGNALFWVNLFPNGTGDSRTVHAGLPVEGGTKHAMNIWPRVFFGPDA